MSKNVIIIGGTSGVGLNTALYLKDLGYKVLIGKRIKNNRIKKWRQLNCVTVCKRLIGINDLLVITPYQLYKKLMNSGNLEYD